MVYFISIWTNSFCSWWICTLLFSPFGLIHPHFSSSGIWPLLFKFLMDFHIGVVILFEFPILLFGLLMDYYFNVLVLLEITHFCSSSFRTLHWWYNFLWIWYVSVLVLNGLYMVFRFVLNFTLLFKFLMVFHIGVSFFGIWFASV